jgi:predicted ATPase
MPDEPTSDAVSFGPFRLIPTQRRLERDGVPVAVGDRALMILLILIEQVGKVVGKRELIGRVWQGMTVEEGNLRFQMVTLRRALGDGLSGARYISTVPGRGYCFVAPIQRPDMAESAGQGHQGHAHQTIDRPSLLPPRLARMVGREKNVAGIKAKLISDRFVSIVGPGGIGKTTVAVAVGHALLDNFDGAVCFVDLGTLHDPALVPGALAAVLGLTVHAGDPVSGVVAALPDERMLIVLDSCEHVIDQAALLAERIFETKPHIHILATSREALRVEGEHIHRLFPLGTPPEGDLTAAAALTFPAVQLFVSRVSAVDDRFDLSDADAPIVAEICRRLDGIALAIELAAGRVEAFGIQGMAARLGDRMELLWKGRRTAPPRHQTLSATLDWSYDLLSGPERAVLRRLSVFVGAFRLEAAERVAAGRDLDMPRVIEALARLVAKSLVTAEIEPGSSRYRLLDTTRAYARGKLIENGEAGGFVRRHAEYYRDLLGVAVPVDADRPSRSFAGEIDNIRAALTWAFSPDGDTVIGIALAANSAPVWLGLSLLTECRSWMARAAACFAANGLAARHELLIQAALGSALMFTAGMSDDAHASWARTLRLARKLGDVEHQLMAMLVLWAMQIRRPVYADAAALARQCRAAAEAVGAAGPIAMAGWMLGVTAHHLGRYAEARRHLSQAIESDDEVSRQVQVKRFGYDRRVDAMAVLGNLLWVQGRPEQGAAMLVRAVAEARGFGHVVPLCMALAWDGFTAILAGGDPGAAESRVGELLELATAYKLEAYRGLGLSLGGMLQVRRGEIDPALANLASGLEILSGAGYEVFHPILMSEQLRALALSGRAGAEREAVLAAGPMRLDVEHWGIAEVLRLRGEVALLPNGEGPEAAEALFSSALDRARRQDALSWEIRAAVSLARLRTGQRRDREAKALLATVRDRCTEGAGGADLRQARQLLAELARRRA